MGTQPRAGTHPPQKWVLTPWIQGVLRDTVDKWVVCILLECFLIVVSSRVSMELWTNVHQDIEKVNGIEMADF